MNWDMADFLIFGAMLAVIAAVIVLFVRQPYGTLYRLGAGIMALGTLLLIWLNGAVGIIGAAGNGANVMFIGIPLTIAVGAFVARLASAGMMRTMVAAGAVQLAIGAIALVFRLGDTGPAWPHDVIVLTVLFSGLWLFAGLLFRRAAEQPGRPGQNPSGAV